jgi:hypothetical protein
MQYFFGDLFYLKYYSQGFSMLTHITEFQFFWGGSGWVIFCCNHMLVFPWSVIIGHLGCFHISAIIYNAEMNMGMQISFQDPHFNSFRCKPRSGITRSYINSNFNFFEEHPHCFLYQEQHFTLPLTLYMTSSFFTSLCTLVIF